MRLLDAPLAWLRACLRRLRRRWRARPAREVFDEWAAEGRDEGMAEAHGPVARRVLDRLELPRDGRFLDVGCGNGYAVRWAAARMPDGEAVGIDASPEMIRHARERSQGLGKVRFERADFPEHPLPAGAFDAIFSMEVFYYFSDVAAALEATLRLLRPGGEFACVVDYYEENTASHGWPELTGAPMELMSADEWRGALEAAGFVDVRQDRITLPPEEASQDWHSTVGSLVTVGRRRR